MIYRKLSILSFGLLFNVLLFFSFSLFAYERPSDEEMSKWTHAQVREKLKEIGNYSLYWGEKTSTSIEAVVFGVSHLGPQWIISSKENSYNGAAVSVLIEFFNFLENPPPLEPASIYPDERDLIAWTHVDVSNYLLQLGNYKKSWGIVNATQTEAFISEDTTILARGLAGPKNWNKAAVNALIEFIKWHKIQNEPKVENYDQSFYSSIENLEAPQLDGLKQILLLDQEHIILVYDMNPELVNEIDRLHQLDLTGSQLSFYELWVSWFESLSTSKLNWTNKTNAEKIFNKYQIQARINIGEKDLKNTIKYFISSINDARYSSPISPVDVDVVPISNGYSVNTVQDTGQPVTLGGPKASWINHCILKLPFPMIEGKTYKFNIANKVSGEFNFNTKKMVSRALKVNQEGYLSDSQSKYAYFGSFLYKMGYLPLPSTATHFEIINSETEAVEYTGTLEFRGTMERAALNSNDILNGVLPEDKSLISGEQNFSMNFSDFNKPGIYAIHIPGVGRSWPFEISENALARAFYHSFRHFYHQRASYELSAPFTSWTREKGHNDPLYVSENLQFGVGEKPPVNYQRFDVIGGSTDLTKNKGLRNGGWYDAADWDSNERHYLPILDMLYLYENDPDKFTDGQFNLPESNNGFPDILDEAEFGLKIWLQSQNEDGGVSGMVEAKTHYTFDVGTYSFSQPLRSSTLLFAGTAALYARLIKNLKPELSKIYEDAAIKAYQWGMNPENRFSGLIHAAKNRGSGEPYTIEYNETDSHIPQYQVFAGTELFLLTLDASFKNGVRELVNKLKNPYWNWVGSDYTFWFYYSVLKKSTGIMTEAERLQIVNKHYIGAARDRASLLEGNAYRRTWRTYQDFWLGWGASDHTNFNRILAVATWLTEDEGEKNLFNSAIQMNLDFMLGANPLGVSWTTGLGSVYPVKIQHETSYEDGIADPVPGISIYGITGGSAFYDFKNLAYKPTFTNEAGESISEVFFDVSKEVPLNRKYYQHETLNVPQNEFTVHETSAARMFTLGYLLKKDWKPSEALKNHQPKKPKNLHGLYLNP